MEAITSGAVELFDQGFAAPPGRCWNFSHDPDSRTTDRPVACQEPVTLRGIFRVAAG